MIRLPCSPALFGAVLSASLAAQGPFVPVAEQAPAHSSGEVALGSLTVSLRAGVLELASTASPGTSTRRPAPCTDPADTGRVTQLAATGLGQCVVAAERGLFVLDEAHPVADLVSLRDGGLEGALRGVVSAGDGRVFVCTRDAFGCVDLRHRYGFSFGEGQGVPDGPYLGLGDGGGRDVLLFTAAGTFRYRPDQGSPPQPVGGALDRRDLRLDAGAAAPVAPSEVAAGVVQLRARRQHHHLLVPLEDGRLPGLRPGSHAVEVYAIDRDLRRTLVGRHQVEVAPPPQLSKRALLAGAGIAAALLVALAWPRRGRRRAARALLRVGVFGVLALQVMAAGLGYGRSWPFMGFSMYTEVYREGSLLYKPQVLGLRDDGSAVALVDWDLGLRQDGYWQVLSELVYGADAMLQQRIGVLAARRPDYRVTGLRFTDTRKRLTRDGPVDVAPVVLREWRRP